MSRILVYTSPARGHLFPALGVALELQRRGHDVHVRTLADEVERVRELGLSATEIDPAIETIELDDWQARSAMGALKIAMQTFADRAALEVDDVLGAVADTSAEAVLVDTNSWGAQAVAEASGLPWSTFQPYFTALPGRGVPPFGPGLQRATGMWGRVRDAIVGPLAFGKLEKLALPGINAQRTRLGLATLETMEDFLTRPPRVIYFTSESLEYPRDRWPDSFRFVGPGTWGPEAAVPGWITSAERPIVLVTCSTERQADAAILNAALEGLPEAGYFVAGTSAAFAPEKLTMRPPPNTRVERFIPHDAVLPHATAVVCHGGMGITQRALSHGVPVVVVPFGRDQLEVARRVEHAKAGVRLPARNLKASSLASAVDEAIACTPGARRIAAAFSESSGSGGAADAFEELLEKGIAARPARRTDGAS